MRAAWMVIGLALMLSGAPAQGQVVAASPQAASATPVAAAPVVGGPGGQVAVHETVDANEVRDQLAELLRQQPPAVRSVLRVTPSLASNAEFLQPYPALAAYLSRHPEVLQNPTYYFGSPANEDDSPVAQRARVVSTLVEDATAFIGLMALLGAVTWFSKSLLDHQRWKRALKVQADAHARLVERLSSTEDVLAYAQTPAGRQFLESGAPVESARPGLTAPVGRILWSVQVGTVIAVLGVGIFICARMFGADSELVEVASLLRLVGTLGLAVGIGFLVSAAISYVLSQRLGLLPTSEASRG